MIAMPREIVGAPSSGMAENSAALLRICAPTNSAFLFTREGKLASASVGVIAPFATGYGRPRVSFDYLRGSLRGPRYNPDTLPVDR